jgi:PhnB protein
MNQLIDENHADDRRGHRSRRKAARCRARRKGLTRPDRGPTKPSRHQGKQEGTMATRTVKSVPEGYHTLTPYLTQRHGAQAIDFYRRAFGAEVRQRMEWPDGRLMHAEIQIGDSIVMMGDEMPEMGVKSPESLGGSASGLLIYCDDVDAAFDRAVEAGARVEMPLEDMFWGDRYGTLIDPFGHRWSMATHVRDVSEEEMVKAQAAWLAEQAGGAK